MGFFTTSAKLPSSQEALPGRDIAVEVPQSHFVNGNSLRPPFPENHQSALFAMGCFWGAEKLFWQVSGVFTTAVGYAGGHTNNPSYEEVCSGMTGHTEAVLVVWDPEKVTFDRLLTIFWEGHNPTQGMRQGNDMGTQYRSAIYTTCEKHYQSAIESQRRFQAKLLAQGYPPITTEMSVDDPFFYAEHYHQQYLAKVPNGYCGLGGTGVCFAD
ncbi:MAG: peptide-methionine (S)-S-oxide reductase MsrA [Gammaproteobacteria bacterium]|jgi:peptide-methionine (S)-S-oxide reductase|nr:peptide-methionine (S)-S-oxide reductase MsrA [Gammaproteobacteria bacterium]